MGGTESLKGKLLVATPGLLDPNFFRTVVLVLEHAEDGAVGVVLNRPSDFELVAALPDWEECAATPCVVFVGGPVSEGTAICLGRVGDSDDISVVDASGDPDDLDATEVRFFSGYAGWGREQLQDEIDEGAWLVLDAEPEDALDCEPELLWSRVLERQGGRIALLARYPDDPTTN
ncbi:MAG: putative transcriptional regulator [Actinomycetota bacterium]|nr:putative transcriptional regulator [Actinomycetota bacterium]